MSEEQRQKLLDQCAQEYGHITPVRSETSAATTASAARKGLTTTSTSVASFKPKRSVDKLRELHQRHSDGEVPTTAKKGLNEEFDKVVHVDGEGGSQDDEPELIADVQPRREQDEAAPPPWWGGAWQAIEHKIDNQAGAFADRMAAMFVHTNERFGHTETMLAKQAESTQRALAELDEKTNRESRHREKENAENMKRIGDRL